MKNSILLILSLLACSCSCSRSADYDFFKTRGESDCISFSVDMNDTLYAYNMYILLRYNSFTQRESIPVEVTILSPTSVRASETVTLPSSRNLLKKNKIKYSCGAGYYDVQYSYREGIIPNERGMWQISLTLPEDEKRVTGAGIITEKIPIIRK